MCLDCGLLCLQDHRGHCVQDSSGTGTEVGTKVGERFWGFLCIILLDFALYYSLESRIYFLVPLSTKHRITTWLNVSILEYVPRKNWKWVKHTWYVNTDNWTWFLFFEVGLSLLLNSPRTHTIDQCSLDLPDMGLSLSSGIKDMYRHALPNNAALFPNSHEAKSAWIPTSRPKCMHNTGYCPVTGEGTPTHAIP